MLPSPLVSGVRPASKVDNARVAEFLEVLQTEGYAIDTEADQVMAEMYAAAILAVRFDAISVLRYGGLGFSWLVREHDDPKWGVGVRLDFDYGRRFITWGLRQSQTGLVITAELQKLDERASLEQLRAEHIPALGFYCRVAWEPDSDLVHAPWTAAQCEKRLTAALKLMFANVEQDPSWGSHSAKSKTQLAEGAHNTAFRQRSLGAVRPFMVKQLVTNADKR